jgi:hypothetical protein
LKYFAPPLNHIIKYITKQLKELNEMTNIQSKIAMPQERESFVIGRNKLNQWYADFGKNYPRTQEYAQQTMVNEIQHWTIEIITFVVTQATFIAMNFKIGKYNKYLKAQSEIPLETIIDSFVYNYLTNATENINKLVYACGNWNMILCILTVGEGLKADCYIDRSIKNMRDVSVMKKKNAGKDLLD